MDAEAEILLLLGGDVLSAHKVWQQISGPHDAPFAQRLDLVWVVIGEVCLGNVHKPTVNALKTHVLDSCRHFIFKPFASFMSIKETQPSFDRPSKSPERLLGQTVVKRTEHNRLAPSRKDSLFLEIIEKNVPKDDANKLGSTVASCHSRNHAITYQITGSRQPSGWNLCNEISTRVASTMCGVHGEDL